MLRMIITTAHSSSWWRWYPECVWLFSSLNECRQWKYMYSYPILPITPKSSLIHTFIVCKRGKQNQYTVMQGKLGICVICFSSVQRLWCFDLSLTPRHLPPHPLSLYCTWGRNPTPWCAWILAFCLKISKQTKTTKSNFKKSYHDILLFSGCCLPGGVDDILNVGKWLHHLVVISS